MRIDAYNQIQAVYQAQATRKPQATAKTGTSFVDNMQLLEAINPYLQPLNILGVL